MVRRNPRQAILQDGGSIDDKVVGDEDVVEAHQRVAGGKGRSWRGLASNLGVLQ